MLWGVVGFSLLIPHPDGGANIGAGILALVALALSILAATSVLMSATTPASRAVGRACIIGWVLWAGLSMTDVVPWNLGLMLALIPLALLFWCFVLALRLPRRRAE